MDKYLTSHNITVQFTPWFPSGWKFTRLILKEELGGKLAEGVIDLQCNGDPGAISLLKDEKKGQLTLTDNNTGNTLVIPIIITNKSHNNHYLTMTFYCGITNSEFFDINKTQIHEKPIKKVIESLYPGKVDIRPDCETDLALDPPPVYFYKQNQETNQNFCIKLCEAYKESCIFTFGWEGLMLKDTYGNKNSHGLHDSTCETQMRINIDSAHVVQRDTMDRPLNKPSIYDFPVNIFEDTEGKVAIKDYTDWEPINFKCMAKMDERYMMHNDYYQMDHNFSYNREYMQSILYNQIVITNRDFPSYRIGDVLYVKITGKIAEKSYSNWIWRKYLVRSNEIFLTVDGSGYIDEDGQPFGWTSKLVCLEEDDSFKLNTEADTLEGV